MPESISHCNLVEELKAYIAPKYCNGETGYLLYDSFGGNVHTRPREIGGFIPDIFACPINGKMNVIIGEAKTYSDIENSHSISQFAAYLNYCHSNNAAILVVAVPWTHERLAKNLLAQIAKKAGHTNRNWCVPPGFRG